MVVIGVSWFVYWALVDVFNVDALKAVLANALIFIILGLLTEGTDFKAWFKK